MGDVIAMEHDTEEGPRGEPTHREEEPVGDTLTQKDQGVNNHIRSYKSDYMKGKTLRINPIKLI